jgi:hypothetical protein
MQLISADSSVFQADANEKMLVLFISAMIFSIADITSEEN